MILDKNFRIAVDAYNFTLIKSEETENINLKTGKPIISKGEWHYPRLRQTLKKYVDESLRVCSTLEEVMDKLEELDSKIDGKHA